MEEKTTFSSDCTPDVLLGRRINNFVYDYHHNRALSFSFSLRHSICRPFLQVGDVHRLREDNKDASLVEATGSPPDEAQWNYDSVHPEAALHDKGEGKFMRTQWKCGNWFIVIYHFALSSQLFSLLLETVSDVFSFLPRPAHITREAYGSVMDARAYEFIVICWEWFMIVMERQCSSGSFIVRLKHKSYGMFVGANCVHLKAPLHRQSLGST